MDREREKCAKPDPRLVIPGSLEPKVFRRSTGRLKAMEAGEPTQFPWWMLGGWSEQDERIRRLKREDRSITAWMVYPDDTVMPLRNSER